MEPGAATVASYPAPSFLPPGRNEADASSTRHRYRADHFLQPRVIGWVKVGLASEKSGTTRLRFGATLQPVVKDRNVRSADA